MRFKMQRRKRLFRVRVRNCFVDNCDTRGRNNYVRLACARVRALILMCVRVLSKKIKKNKTEEKREKREREKEKAKTNFSSLHCPTRGEIKFSRFKSSRYVHVRFSRRAFPITTVYVGKLNVTVINVPRRASKPADNCSVTFPTTRGDRIDAIRSSRLSRAPRNIGSNERELDLRK